MNGMIVYNLLYNIATDYRVKSIQLAFFKYNRYYPDHQAELQSEVLVCKIKFLGADFG